MSPNDVSQTVISIVFSPEGGSVLTNQKVTARLTAVDQFGNPVTLVGPFSWSINPTSAAAIVPSADTLSAEITPITAGTVTVTAIGQGTSASASLPIEALVINLTITFDAPVPL